MGRKYEFKADSNPAPGQYDPDASPVKSRLTGGTINKKTTTYRKPQESLPDPGQYQTNTITFGSGLKGIDMGKKYEFKVDSNPRVG